MGIGIFMEGLHFCQDQIGQVHMALLLEIIVIMGRPSAPSCIQHPRYHFAVPVKRILGIDGDHMAGPIPVSCFFIISGFLVKDPHLEDHWGKIPRTMVDEMIQLGRSIHESLLVILSIDDQQAASFTPDHAQAAVGIMTIRSSHHLSWEAFPIQDFLYGSNGVLGILLIRWFFLRFLLGFLGCYGCSLGSFLGLLSLEIKSSPA